MSEVLLILEDQIQQYGGRYGLRDAALLSSALAMPMTTFEGKLLHADLYDQAAAYAFHICQNHPFVDGNKRIALATALVFLDLNGIQIEDLNELLYSLMIKVAQGKATKVEISDTFRTHGSKRKKRE